MPTITGTWSRLCIRDGDHPTLKRRLMKDGERVRGYINTVLQYQQPKNFPFMNDIDDAQDKFDRVVDLLDNSLEKVVRVCEEKGSLQWNHIPHARNSSTWITPYFSCGIVAFFWVDFNIMRCISGFHANDL